MSEAAVHPSLDGSRLLRYLDALQVSGAASPQQHLAQRLGALIDLPDSIKLSGAHAKLHRLAFEPTGFSPEDIKREFLRMRMAMVQSVVRTFAPRPGPSRIKLPAPEAIPAADPAEAYEPYRKFYTGHQRDMEFRVQQLQSQLREAATGLSPDLARLAALDKALGETLVAQTRKFLAVIPQLLGKHFTHLHHAYQQSVAAPQDPGEDWIQCHNRFCADMQGLLLAEIETRLMPALGLVEAITKDTD